MTAVSDRAGMGQISDLQVGNSIRSRQHLLDLTGEEQIGLGTPRLTVAAAAVYAADRLTDDKWLTQLGVVAGANSIVETSTGKIGTYSRQLYDAFVERHGTDDPSVVFEQSNFPME